MTTKLLGLSGSLRQLSFNTSLLRAAVPLAGDAAQLDAATLHGIPLYDGDLEQREGTPAAVRELKEKILASDGLLLVTPEYNNGIPGVFKNAVDWLSRPTPGLPDVFRDRPVAVIGASPGASAPSCRKPTGCRCCAPWAPTPGRAGGSWFRARRPCSAPTARCWTTRCASSSANSCRASRPSSRPRKSPERAAAVQPGMSGSTRCASWASDSCQPR